MTPDSFSFDVVMVGGGHAGVEAAYAAARLGGRVALVTLERRAIVRLSCNPAIGGQAKGQIVREIDALGGVMGLAADATGIQFRMLNRSKGPAVWAPRSQQDKPLYTEWMLAFLERQPLIEIVEGQAVALMTSDSGIEGVILADGRRLRGQSVVICTGTFLDGLMHIGLESFEGGRIHEPAAKGLSNAFREVGLRVGRLKTGTPPRLRRDTIDYDQCRPQEGDPKPQPYSYLYDELTVDQVCCHITYTNPVTHEAIRKNLDRSPLYAGVIKSIGPRYCPSIEDKVVRFADRDRHQIFLEPESRTGPEVYANGIPTSLPRDVQDAIVRSIPGLEHAEIMQYGYAVEYTYAPSIQLRATLESKIVPGLYFAGQVNGTSGYEEAAGQGLMAGANAALRARGDEEWVLGRDEAYIGVLIDDLVTQEITEPYRMFTSRAEHRLILRQDNADLRLTEKGRALGLVDDARYNQFMRYREELEREMDRLRATRVKPADYPETFLERAEMERPTQNLSLAQLLTRPAIGLEELESLEAERAAKGSATPALDGAQRPSRRAREQAAIQLKYAGYIDRQIDLIARQRQWEERRLPEDLDYASIRSLSNEGRARLAEARPRTLGQAGRVFGVTPADVEVLMIHLKGREG